MDGWPIPSAVSNIRVYPRAALPGTIRACIKGRLNPRTQFITMD